MTLKILLADDNKTFVTAVNQFLDMLPGAEVVGLAYDGHEALTKADELQPDLVLLDIAMPGLNGLEVARRLHAWPHPPHIVFLSIHDSAAYRDAAHELGAKGYVGKADFVVELLPIIERLAMCEPDGNLLC